MIGSLLPRWPRVGAAVLVATLGVGAVRADELVIGFEDVYLFPYGMPSKEETYVGYLRRLLDLFAEERGHSLEFAVTPLKRLFPQFKSGEVDLFVPDNPAWSLEYKEGIEIYYSEPIAVALDGFAMLSGKEEPDENSALTIGVILGFTVDPLFDEAQRERIVFDRAPRFESIFRALFLDRIDAAYCNVATTRQMLTKLGKPPDAITWSTSLPRFKSPYHVSSTRRELIEEFNRWLEANEAEVTRLKEAYGLMDAEASDWGD